MSSSTSSFIFVGDKVIARDKIEWIDFIKYPPDTVGVKIYFVSQSCLDLKLSNEQYNNLYSQI